MREGDQHPSIPPEAPPHPLGQRLGEDGDRRRERVGARLLDQFIDLGYWVRMFFLLDASARPLPVNRPATRLWGRGALDPPVLGGGGSDTNHVVVILISQRFGGNVSGISFCLLVVISDSHKKEPWKDVFRGFLRE